MSGQSRKGVKKQIAGSLKEAIGIVAGDPKVESEGAIEKTEGEAERRAPHPGLAERLTATTPHPKAKK